MIKAGLATLAIDCQCGAEWVEFVLTDYHVHSGEPEKNLGLCKTPKLIEMFFFFTRYRFFQFIVFFPSAHFTPWSKNSHERVKGKGRERWRKDSGSLARTILMPKVIEFSLSFSRSWILCMFLFFWNWYHQKPMTTYQAPSLRRIWHALAFHYNNRPKHIGFQEPGHRSKKQPTSMAHVGSWKTKRIGTPVVLTKSPMCKWEQSTHNLPLKVRLWTLEFGFFTWIHMFCRLLGAEPLYLFSTSLFLH